MNKLKKFITRALLVAGLSSVGIAGIGMSNPQTVQAADSSSTYTITIPKAIEYSNMSVGTVNESVSYEVETAGTLPDGKTLNVTGSTDSSLTASNGSDPLTVTYSQDRTEWSYDDVAASEYATATVTLSGDAGVDTYSGVISYDVELTNNSYTIVFDANGGDGEMAEEAMTYDTEAALTTNTFTRTGYTFSGWNTSASGDGTSYTDGETVSNLATDGTVTLYAQWTANIYKISLDGNGATDNGTASIYEKYATGLYSDSTASTALESITIPTWEYTVTYVSNATGVMAPDAQTYSMVFDGYYDGSTQLITSDGIPTDDFTTTRYTAATTLTASWSEGTALTLESALTRTGYTFAGWNTSSDGNGTTYDADSEFTPTADTTLYAMWTPITYTVVFDANGGSGTMDSQTLTYDTAEKLTDNSFTYSSHSFMGWSTTADGDVEYTDAQSVVNLASTADATVTLYAQWKLTYSMFSNGTAVNIQLKTLAGDTDATSSSENTTITAFERADSLPSGFTASDDNTLSIEDSMYPIYAWYSDGTIYWYCEDSSVYMSTNASGMFRGLTAATTISLDGMNSTKTTNMSNMFYGDAAVTALDLSGLDTSLVASSTDFMTGCVLLAQIDIGTEFTLQSDIITPSSDYITGATGLWYDSNGTGYAPADIPTNTANTYYASSDAVPGVLMPQATWYKGDTDPSTITIIQVTNSFSADDLETESWNADVGDTGAITCHVVDTVLYIVNEQYSDGIGTITLSPDISGMFADFTSVTSITGLDIFNSIQVTTASNMFGDDTGAGATSLTRLEGIESWNTSGLTTADYMFSAINVSSLDLSGWNISALTDAEYMFAYTNMTTVDLSGWDVSGVENMTGMFENTGLTTINIAGWDTSAVTAADSMFYNSTELARIYATDITSFDSASTTDMFTGDTSLVGGNGTAYDSSYIDGTYARVDKSYQAGYFTNYIIGSGEITAKIYETDTTSTSYTDLTEDGVDITWDYSAGNKLLEIHASNLSTSKTNTITVTVPMGLQIVADSWTTSDDSDISAVSFTQLEDQGTNDAYTSTTTGTLTFTVESTSSSADITCLLAMDQTLWDKRSYEYSETYLNGDETALTVTLDSSQSLLINNCAASAGFINSYSTDNGYVLNYTGYIVNAIYVEDDAQAISTYNGHWLALSQSCSTYIQSMDIDYSLTGTDSSGNTIYAEFAGLAHDAEGQSEDPTVSNNIAHVHSEYYVDGQNIFIGDPSFYVRESDGFVVGDTVTENIDVTIVFYNGSTQTWSASNTFTLKSSDLDYDDISIKTSGKISPVGSWHENDDILDILGMIGIQYIGIADPQNIGVDIVYDSDTAESSTPCMYVSAARIPIPSGETDTVSVTLQDSTGTYYGPYSTSITSSSDANGGFLSAESIASTAELSGTYYLKEVSYTIQDLQGSESGRYLWYPGNTINPNAAGVFAGQITSNAVTTMTLSFEDGTSKSSQVTSKAETSPTTNDLRILSNSYFSDTSITAGEDVTLYLYAGTSGYPYGDTDHVKDITVYIKLPDGASITSATTSTTAGGTALQTATIQAVKQITEDGNTYYIWEISLDEPVNIGGYYDTGSAIGIYDGVWINAEISTDSSMSATSFVLKDNMWAFGDGVNSYYGWGQFCNSDSYDVDDDSTTTLAATLWNSTYGLTISEATTTTTATATSAKFAVVTTE